MFPQIQRSCPNIPSIFQTYIYVGCIIAMIPSPTIYLYTAGESTHLETIRECALNIVIWLRCIGSIPDDAQHVRLASHVKEITAPLRIPDTF
jgi:hypothetical protein